MPRSVPALVKPELLVWARESAGLSVLKAAELAHIDEFTLSEWERGHEAPSLAQLRKLGDAYKRPIAVFFLAEPPRRFDAQREFRRLAGIQPGEASSELLLALRWATFRKEAAVELHRLRGERPERVHGRLHPDADPEDSGARMRALLGISWDQQLAWSSPYQALSAWRAAIEAQGVLVFQTSDVELSEMRATCIPDQPLPVILLNAKDAPHGRVFSLMHEFAHILLHAGGHRTSRMVGERSPEEQPLEVAANSFSASALLPATEFTEVARQYRAASDGDNDALRLLALKVKVSPEAILRRLVNLHRAAERVYKRKREAWGSTVWYVKAPNSSGGPPMEVKTIAKDGPAYTRLVLDSYDQRLINTSAASDYLGVKPRHFASIRRELSQPPLADV